MSHSTGEATSRPTVARALVRFPCAQYTARDGERHRLIAGTRGIVGHGNVTGAGRAPLALGDATPCHQGHDEQAGVRAAVGHARRPDRPPAQAVTTAAAGIWEPPRPVRAPEGGAP
ncbi:hypothetical protein ACH41H_03170 [Streptomyces sp. NPDC020800]|uniref:hypothetical protein n=1 Tax=Streptomyces sp. NPDC020800 TaxID=3365092 RepID=UPI00378B25A6